MPSAPDTEETAARRYTAMLRRRRWLIALPAVLAPLVALGLSFAHEDRYRASAEVLLVQPTSAVADGVPGDETDARMVQNELRRAQGSALQDRVRDLVGGEPELSVRPAGDGDTDVLVFAAESTDPDLAARAANVYAEEYIDQRRTSLADELVAREDAIEARLTELDVELERAEPDAGEPVLAEQRRLQAELDSVRRSLDLGERSVATLIDVAAVPDSPFSPRPVRDTLFALAAGIAIGFAAALVVEQFDNTLRDEDELARLTDVPVLAVIPKYDETADATTPSIVSREEPASQPAEAYRLLRTSVQFMNVGEERRVVQFTSARPGDGKTTTSVNLAVAAARAGRRVIVVDCDLRRPKVHEFFGLPNDVGFTTAMIGASLDEVAHPIDGEPDLWMTPSGAIPPDPSELLSSPAAKQFVRSLTDRFDLVIVDTPPVLVVTDPLIVSAAADAVVLVAAAKLTDRRQIAAAAQQLRQVGAPLAGTVLNGFDLSSSTTFEYRYAYGRYSADGA